MTVMLNALARSLRIDHVRPITDLMELTVTF